MGDDRFIGTISVAQLAQPGHYYYLPRLRRSAQLLSGATTDERPNKINSFIFAKRTTGQIGFIAVVFT